MDAVESSMVAVGALVAGVFVGVFAFHRPPPVMPPQPVRIVKVAADCGDAAALPRGNAAAVIIPETNPSGAALLGRSGGYSEDPKLRALQLKAETAENIARVKAASETYRANMRYRERIYTGR